MQPAQGESTPNKHRKVIILTDNRQTSPPHSTNKPPSLSQQPPTTTATKYSKKQSQQQEAVEGPSLQQIKERVDRLQLRVGRIERAVDQGQGRRMARGRNRRCFAELQRNLQCPLCERVYGSETSLKLHIKLKHPTSPQ